MTHKLIYNIGLYSISAVLLKGIGFTVMMWIARSLSVEEFSNFGLFYAIQSGVVAFTMAGIVEVLVGLLKNNKSLIDQLNLFSASNAIFIIFSIIVISLFIVYMFFVDESSIQYRIIIYPILGGIFLGFSTLQAQLFRLQEKHHTYILFSFVIPVFGFIGTIISFYLYKSIASFFLGYLIAISCSFLIVFAKQNNIFQIKFDRKNLEIILQRIAPYILIAIFGWLSGYGNNHIINIILEKTDVANFTFLLSLTIIIQIVSRSINQVWGPRFYSLSNSMPQIEVEKKNRVVYSLMGIVMGLVGVFILIFLRPMLQLVGGNLIQYQHLHLEVLLMIIAYIFLIPWWHCHNYYLFHNRGKQLMVVTLSSSIAGLSIWFLLMINFGSIGVYIGFFLQMFIRSAFIYISARKQWPIKIAWEGILIGCVIPFVGYLLG